MTPAQIAQGIQQGDPAAAGALYEQLREWRYGIWRRIGAADADDLLHDAFVATLEFLRRGQMRNPDAMFGLVRGVLRNKEIQWIDRRRIARECVSIDFPWALAIPSAADDPEVALLVRERRRRALCGIRRLRPGDREIIVRFYLAEETPEQICTAMRLSPTQFRLKKSRALDRIRV